MAETDLWFGTLTATVRVEDLPASRRVVAIELPVVGEWRVCGAGTSNVSGVATLPITGLPTSRIYAVAIDDWGRPFVPGMTVAFGDVIRPTQFLGWMYQVTAPGVMPSTEPEWWNGMAGIPQSVGTAMMQAIRHYQPIAHGPVSDIEWEEMEFDPHWDKVVSLLPFDGEDSTSNTIVNDMKGVIWHVHPSVVAKEDLHAFNGSGAYFHGSGAALEGPPIIPETENWTMEFRFKPDSIATAVHLIGQNRRSSPNANNRFVMEYMGNNQLFIGHNNGSSWSSITFDYTPNPTGYESVMVYRDGDVLGASVNGSPIVRGAEIQGLRFAQEPFTIGVYYNETNKSFQGVIDEFRLTADVVRHPDSFTPATGPFPRVGPPL